MTEEKTVVEEIVETPENRRKFIRKLALVGGIGGIAGFGIGRVSAAAPAEATFAKDYLSLIPRSTRPLGTPEDGIWIKNHAPWIFDGVTDRRVGLPIFDVKDYGAKGSPTIDTTSFQNALDAIDTQGGGTLFIPFNAAGYLVGDLSYGSHTIIEGDGDNFGTTGEAIDAKSSLIYIGTGHFLAPKKYRTATPGWTSGVVLRNLNIKTQLNTGICAIHFWDNHDILLERVVIHGNWISAWEIDGSSVNTDSITSLACRIHPNIITNAIHVINSPAAATTLIGLNVALAATPNATVIRVESAGKLQQFSWIGGAMNFSGTGARIMILEGNNCFIGTFFSPYLENPNGVFQIDVNADNNKVMFFQPFLTVVFNITVGVSNTCWSFDNNGIHRTGAITGIDIGSTVTPFDTLWVRNIDAATADLIQMNKVHNINGPTGQPMRIRGRWTANPRLIMATDDSTGSSIDRLELTGNVVQGSAKITSRENIDFGNNVSIVIKQKAGVPSDADFAQPVDGLLAIDTTNNRIYVRIGTVWKSVTVV